MSVWLVERLLTSTHPPTDALTPLLSLMFARSFPVLIEMNYFESNSLSLTQVFQILWECCCLQLTPERFCHLYYCHTALKWKLFNMDIHSIDWRLALHQLSSGHAISNSCIVKNSAFHTGKYDLYNITWKLQGSYPEQGSL